MPTITVELERTIRTRQRFTYTDELSAEVADRFRRGDPDPETWAQFSVAPSINEIGWRDVNSSKDYAVLSIQVDGVGIRKPEPVAQVIHLTKRQAEALWAARERGSINSLRGRGGGGGKHRMFERLAELRLITWGRDYGDTTHGVITPKGITELALWEQEHPRIKLQPEVYGK